MKDKKKRKESEVAQSCPSLCDPMDCSLPGSSVHGIVHARVLEWVAISFSRGIFLTQGLNLRLLRLPHCRLTLYPWPHLLRYVTLIPSTEQTGNKGLMTPTLEMRQLRGRWFSQGHRAGKC